MIPVSEKFHEDALRLVESMRREGVRAEARQPEAAEPEEPQRPAIGEVVVDPEQALGAPERQDRRGLRP